MHPIKTPLLTRKTIYTAVSLTCTLAFASQATAAASDSKSFKLEEVVVTAQKREQAMIDVPISVSAVSAESLANGALTRLADYAAQVPGMSVTALTRGYSSVVLRGISTGISQATPSTAYYIDEAPIGSINAYAAGSTHTPDLDPYDLQRIEVLKGPQGTLYGAGAVGGLLRYVSVKPDSKSFGGAVTVGGNSVNKGGNGSEARLSLNVPLVQDSMAVRISAFTREEAGYIDNTATGESDINEATTSGARVALGWDINDDWSLQAWGLTQKFEADGIGVEHLNSPGLTPVTRELERSVLVPEKQIIELDAFNATLKGEFGDFSLVSSTTYQMKEAETHVDQSPTFGPLLLLQLGIPNIGAETVQMVDTERWSQEVRLGSTTLNDALAYEVGLFYTNEENSNILPPDDPFLTTTGQPFPLGIPLADAKILSEYEEYSVFANATYTINDKLELLAGVRLSRDEQDYTQDYKLALLSPTPVLIVQNVKNDNTSFLLSARYKPNADTSVYARVANGYRPGGPSALPPGIIPGGKQSFDSDTLLSYEIGYKTVFLDGRASLESALFTTDWDDIQIQTSTQTNAGTFQYFVNGGAANSSGAEAALTFLPIEALTLRATGAFTNSKLTEDVPLVGGVDGDRMPFVPKWTGSLSADYRFTLAGSAAWVGGSINYIGERKSDFSQDANYLNVDSYTTINLNAGIDFEHLTVSLYGKNLADERGITFMNNGGFALPSNPRGNPFNVGVIEPRTIGANVSYRF